MPKDLASEVSGNFVSSMPDAPEQKEPLVKRSRVLHIDSGNLYGGVESILVTLASLRELCPAMEPQFAVCHEGRLSKELAEAGVCVYNVGNVRISRPWTVWRARRRLREVLERESFDLVICHMPWSLAVFGPAVTSSGTKLGFWAHAFHHGTGWLERLAQRAKPEVVIANSRYTRGGLENLFPHVPQAVIYPPVALRQTSDIESPGALRRQLGADENTVVIIQVSRIEECKGHAVHLQALAKLKELPTHWVCWIVGGAQRPQEQEKLQELIRMTKALGIDDRVRFLGGRRDVASLLSAADVFCQPNQTPDSFGITFVEALWAGKPVVTASLGGALEVVDDSCGLLFPAGNADNLAALLKRMIEDPELRRRLGLAGPSRARWLSDPARQMDLLHQISRGETREVVTA